MAIHKAGRRKKDGERFPSGDLKPEKMTATPERAAQRALLTRGADPALAESPLGVLLAHALIDEEAWRAADRYAAAKRIRYGSVQPKGTNLTGAGKAAYNPALDAGSERGEIWAKAALEKSEAFLAHRPRRHRDILDNFVVYNRFPIWIADRVLSPAHRPELAVLLEMLEELARCFGIRQPSVALSNHEPIHNPKVHDAVVDPEKGEDEMPSRAA